MSPAVGISTAMLVSMAAIHVPGHAITVAVILGVATLAAIVWCSSEPAHLPPLRDFLAAAPVAAMALIPYLAVMRAGIPGVDMDNDMTAHLLWAEEIVAPGLRAITSLPPDYPLGPHAMAAVLSKGLGIRIDQAFAGWILALPLINAWTALAFVRRAPWLGKAVVATVVGMPFLVAAYYGEGSFKEVLLASLVMALVALLVERRPVDGRGRWVPVAVVLGGILSIYSVAGLPWPGLILGAWIVIAGALQARRDGLRSLLGIARREVVPVAIALVVLAVSLVPQIPRIVHFVTLRASVNGTGIEASELGNLLAPIPGWESFGVWNAADFRHHQAPGFGGVFWVALAVALVLAGLVWALRKRRWGLVLAAVVAMLIWAVSTQSQSPYVAAKALVIASPLLLLLAVLPLVEGRVTLSRRWTLVPFLAAFVLAFGVVTDSVEALRISPIGPTDHLSELRSLRSTIAGQPTLFLGNDDFAQWELAGARLSQPIEQGVENQLIPFRKAWKSGEPIDFDTVDAATLNANRWVITIRDAAGSAPPPQLRLVRSTPNYLLWRRVGRVKERSILNEGKMPGAILECDTAAGRKALRGGGVAAVRGEPIAVPFFVAVPAGQTASIALPLPPGRWALEATFISPLSVAVTAPGMESDLQPNLDRLGTRWPIGAADVHGTAPTPLTFAVDKTHFTPDSDAATIDEVIAVPLDEPEKVVPIRRACGKYVDWYRSAAQDR